MEEQMFQEVETYHGSVGLVAMPDLSRISRCESVAGARPQIKEH